MPYLTRYASPSSDAMAADPAKSVVAKKNPE
jgi:hypothetical protein